MFYKLGKIKIFACKNIILFIFLALISSCSTNETNCIAGDNFDGRNNSFNSHIPSGSNSYNDDFGNSDPNKETIRWQNTKYITTGENLVFNVKKRWSAWGEDMMIKEDVQCQSGAPVLSEPGYIDDECDNLPTSNIVGLNGSTFQAPYLTMKNNPFPCWLTKGMGLYLLLAKPGYNPNSSIRSMKNPNAATIHVGHLVSDGAGRFKINALNGFYDESGNPAKIEENMTIYIKILDRYYEDNYGEYEIDFLEGIKMEDEFGFFNDTYNWIMKDFFNNIKDLFNNIIFHPAYRNSVLTLMILYIITVSLAFLTGFIKAQLGELTLRLLKIGFVFIMLTPYAWKFFNENLFNLYFDGVGQIVHIISGDERNYDSKKPFAFMDKVINKFYGKFFFDTRLRSVMFANFLLGILWLAIVMIILVFMFVMFLYCFCIYVLGMITLGFLTLTLPIFITFVLFNFTRSFFNEWINLIFSTSFKIIMTFATLIFFINVVEYEFQKTIGYKICPASVINFNIFELNPNPSSNSFFDLRQYVPGETSRFQTMNIFQFIFSMFAMSKRYGFDPVVVNMLAPPFYENLEFRYQSLPYLNPNTKGNPDMSAISICRSLKTIEACHPDILFPEDKDSIEHTQIIDMMFSKNSYSFIYFWRLFSILILCVVLWVIGINYIESFGEYIAFGGQGLVMPSGNLGSGIKMMHNRYAQYMSKFAQSNNKLVKTLSGVLLAVTTPEGFILRKGLVGDKVKNLLNNVTSPASNLAKKALGLDGHDSLAQRMIGRFVDNIRYFDSSTDPNTTTRSSASLARQVKKDQINMIGLNRMRDTVGLFIEGVEKTADNIQHAALLSSINISSHMVNSANLAMSVAKNAINGVSTLSGKGKIFQDISTSDIKDQFYNTLFNSEFIGEDASKVFGIDNNHRLGDYLDTMDAYYNNIYSQYLADNRDFDPNPNPIIDPQNTNPNGIGAGNINNNNPGNPFSNNTFSNRSDSISNSTLFDHNPGNDITSSFSKSDENNLFNNDDESDDNNESYNNYNNDYESYNNYHNNDESDNNNESYNNYNDDDKSDNGGNESDNGDALNNHYEDFYNNNSYKDDNESVDNNTFKINESSDDNASLNINNDDDRVNSKYSNSQNNSFNGNISNDEFNNNFSKDDNKSDNGDVLNNHYEDLYNNNSYNNEYNESYNNYNNNDESDNNNESNNNDNRSSDDNESADNNTFKTNGSSDDNESLNINNDDDRFNSNYSNIENNSFNDDNESDNNTVTTNGSSDDNESLNINNNDDSNQNKKYEENNPDPLKTYQEYEESQEKQKKLEDTMKRVDEMTRGGSKILQKDQGSDSDDDE